MLKGYRKIKFESESDYNFMIEYIESLEKRISDLESKTAYMPVDNDKTDVNYLTCGRCNKKVPLVYTNQNGLSVCDNCYIEIVNFNDKKESE